MKEFSFKYVCQLSLLSNIFCSFSVTSNREAQNDTYLNSINRTNVLFFAYSSAKFHPLFTLQISCSRLLFVTLFPKYFTQLASYALFFSRFSLLYNEIIVRSIPVRRIFRGLKSEKPSCMMHECQQPLTHYHTGGLLL